MRSLIRVALIVLVQFAVPDSASAIIIHFPFPGPYRMGDHTIRTFQSVTVFESTTTDPFVVSFDEDDIWVNAGAGQRFEVGQRLILVIPEPSAGWLLASGFALLAALTRRA